MSHGTNIQENLSDAFTAPPVNQTTVEEAAANKTDIFQHPFYQVSCMLLLLFR